MPLNDPSWAISYCHVATESQVLESHVPGVLGGWVGPHAPSVTTITANITTIQCFFMAFSLWLLRQRYETERQTNVKTVPPRATRF